MAIWTLSGHNQNDMSFKAVSQLPCNLVSCVPIPHHCTKVSTPRIIPCGAFLLAKS